MKQLQLTLTTKTRPLEHPQSSKQTPLSKRKQYDEKERHCKKKSFEALDALS